MALVIGNSTYSYAAQLTFTGWLHPLAAIRLRGRRSQCCANSLLLLRLLPR
jgi:hypothetical protein